MRERVGMVDLTAFCEFDITGPGAMAYLQYMWVNNVDRARRTQGVHATAHTARWLPRRSHDHAPCR